MNTLQIAATCSLALLANTVSVRADLISISYTAMTMGEVTDLTTFSSAGGVNLDWVKWGGSGDSGLSFSTIEKSGGTLIDPTLTMIDPTAPGAPDVVAAAFSGPLAFDWSDGATITNGTGVDTIVTQTMTPAQAGYPIAIGQSFNVQATGDVRVLDVFVQGFDSDMLLTASMSGGDTDSIIVPIDDPSTLALGGNFFSVGRFQVVYRGLGQTLTVSTMTVNDGSRMGAQSQFANAGMFAAAVSTPEPASLAMLGVACLLSGGIQLRRRRRPVPEWIATTC